MDSQLSINGTVGGLAIQGLVARRSNTKRAGSETSIPKANNGTLTTRTSDTAGVVTLAANPTVVSGKVTVFWTGGRQAGMTAVVSGTTCTLSVGNVTNGNSALPAQASAVVVCNEVTVDDVQFDGTALSMVAVVGKARICVQWMNSTSVVGIAEAPASDEPYFWAKGVTTSPANNTITSYIISMDAVDDAKTVTVGMDLT